MDSTCNHGLDNDSYYDIRHADKNTKLFKNEVLRYYHLLNLLPGNISEILDIGCGTGYMSQLIAKKKMKVIAIDISEKRLLSFKEIADKLNIKQLHENLFNLKFNNCEAIISQEVIEHIPDYKSALRKMFSFLRNFGFALFCAPYRENLQAKTRKCPYCGEYYHTCGHVNRFTEDSFRNDLINCRFKILKTRLIVNKRTVKWLALFNLPLNNFTLLFNKMMNKFFPHKAAYIAILCQKS